jgi:hypothetical protein
MKPLPRITPLLAILATISSPLQAAVVWAFGDPGITVVSVGGDGRDSSHPVVSKNWNRRFHAASR